MISLHEMFLRLSFAALLGAAIGVERDLHRRPAGIRTSAFVCMGSALFTILSFQFCARNRFSGRGGDFAGGRGTGWLNHCGDDFRRSGHRNGGGWRTLRRWGICDGRSAVWTSSVRLDCAAVEPEVAVHGLSDYREPCREHSRRSAALVRGAEDQAATVSSI